MRLRLEGLLIVTRAGGFSSLNTVERAQAFLTCALDGCFFASDHFGKPQLRADHTPATPEDDVLERKNHAHAVQECVELLSAAVAYDRPVSVI